jgi:fibronectin type 3 domain-containing protein
MVFALVPATASAADPVIAAAGDISCSSSTVQTDRCHMKATSDLLVNAGLSAVLALGDEQYQNGGFSDFMNYYDKNWGRVKSITYPAVGNHEYQTSGASGYFDYFNGVGNATGRAGNRNAGYYSFDIGTWHLISLNSNDACTIVSCSSGSAQDTWLKADLAAHPNYCTLAYWHHPSFNSGNGGNLTAMKPLLQDLYDADADVILGGHAHHYERFAPQNPSGQLDNSRGIRQFIVGTGGAFWTSIGTVKANSQIRQNSTYGVLKMTLHPGSYDWAFVPEAGKTFTDSGTTACHGTGSPPGGSDTQKPTAPQSLTATGGPAQVSLSWQPSTDNVGVTGYRIYRGGTQIASIGTTTSYSDTGLTKGTYSYTVRAVDAAGNLSDPSNTATAAATTPLAVFTLSPNADAPVQESTPTTNYATSALRTDAGTGVNVESYLRFTVSGPTGAVSSAKLRVYATSGTADGPAVFKTDTSWGETAINWSNRPPPTSAATDDKGAIASGSWVEYDVSQLVTGSGTYSFRLAQTSTDGTDFNSREAASLRPELVVTADTEAPTAPAGLSATAAPRQVSLSWQPSTDNVGVTGYRVYRDGGLLTSLGTVTSYTDTGVAPGSHVYSVQAVDAAGNLSAPSNTASATVPDTTKPSAPANLTALGGTAKVDLSWQASSDDVGVTGYRIFRGATQVGSVDGTTTSYTESGLAAGSYTYTVRAVDAAGNLSDPSNSASATVSDTSKPSAPGSLTAAGGTAKVDLSWQASSDDVGVTGYRIFRGATQVGSVGGTTTSYTESGLAAGSYSYTVRAVDAAENLSDPSNSASATVPDTTKPSVPGNLTANGSAGQVALSWQASTDDVGVTGYRIFRGGTQIDAVGGTATSYTDQGLAPGDYSYTVRAVDAAGNVSDASNAASGTVPDLTKPSTPQNLTASANGPTQVDLAWQASTDNVAVTGYNVYRDGTLIASTGTTPSYSDPVLVPGTYSYVVKAFDAAGNLSDASNTATVMLLAPDGEKPTAPANLLATVNGSDVDLTWDASSDNVEVTGYKVYRDGVLLDSISPATSYSDTGVPAGDHGYTVRAVDASGNLSDPSNTATVTVPDTEKPTAPQSLRATAVSSSKVDLTWQASGDDVGVTGYDVYREGTLLESIGPATAYSDTTVTPGSYSYEVHARDAAGNVSDASNAASVTVDPPDTEKPTAPGNLTATAHGASKIDLGWLASTDNVGVTGYDIYRDDTLLASIGPATSYSDNSVVPGVTYSYHVIALDAAANASDPSNTASAMVNPVDNQKPTAPGNLAATLNGTNRVDLSWQPSSDNVGVTGYNVYRDGTIITTTDGTTSYTDGPLDAGTYQYEVRALDAAGNLSNPSNTATVTVPDTQKPTAPQNLTATANGSSQVDLSWQAATDNVGVTGYRVFRGTTQIATLGPSATSYSDTGLSSGTYQYTVNAVDAAGNVSDASNTASATLSVAPAVLTLAPDADARVQASAPTTNYGTSFLRADGGTDPAVESFLRFTVSGVPAGSVRSAKLRVYAYSGTANGPAVYTTGASWSETAVNWNNRPARTSAATDDKGAISSNSWVEYDVTSLVSGDGTYSFDIATNSTDGVDIYSRENATLRPELVISTGAPDTTRPTAPGNLGATAAGPNRIDLSWLSSTDNVAVTGYNVYRGGTLLAPIGPTTTYADTSVAPSSTYSYQLRALDAAGNISDPSNTATATTAAATPVLTFAAEADARAEQSTATTNYGTATTIGADFSTSTSNIESFLRFTVSGVSPGSVSSAKLRLNSTGNGTADGPAIYTTSSSWSETTINWNTRPAPTSAATDDKGAIPGNTLVEYDVTPFVTGNGTYSFRLATSSTDGVYFSSREAATLRPELVVTTH